jgi:hypothetical protein
MDIGPAKTSPAIARPNSALKRLRLAAAITAGLALLAGAGQWVYRHFTHVIVDDARIAADMIALASRSLLAREGEGMLRPATDARRKADADTDNVHAQS